MKNFLGNLGILLIFIFAPVSYPIVYFILTSNGIDPGGQMIDGVFYNAPECRWLITPLVLMAIGVICEIISDFCKDK
ncbi:MAG: hypothetical protein NTX82_07710 [Candidatus Parcubacteria bacterium]|nr:hypothetical protein [Candidatus Parcubacteria bacterium]